ncbi:hypothetical protein F5Y03DRAFT_193667 [Xylaria venustula]|nr:hypothetical protein F5Y03DRAFT_193667 [Xylaria venustula]
MSNTKLFWINELFYNAAMFFIKMTFLSQYYRVFRQVKALRIVYAVAIFIIGGWCLGQFLAVVFLCIPVRAFWDKTVEAKCQNQLIGVYLNAVGTLVTDFAILVLPIPAIWNLHLPRTQKWALTGIFSIGIFTSAISIVRITTVGSPNADLTYYAATSSCWSVAELSSGIIAASLATVRPLVGRLVPSFSSKVNGAVKAYHQYIDEPPTGGSSRRVSMITSLGRFPKDKIKHIMPTNDTKSFPAPEIELQETQTQRKAPRRERGQSMDTLNIWGRESDSFNIALEDEGPSLAPVERSASQRSSAYCYYESSSRDSDADLGLWPGTHTKVIGGLQPLPRLGTEEAKVAKPQGLKIRVDRDWEVRETYVEM